MRFLETFWKWLKALFVRPLVVVSAEASRVLVTRRWFVIGGYRFFASSMDEAREKFLEMAVRKGVFVGVRSDGELCFVLNRKNFIRKKLQRWM